MDREMQGGMGPMENLPAEVSAVDKIGEEQIAKAMTTLMEYKKGKENLEKRIVENEQFWKMRHWDGFDKNSVDKATSGWLVNVVLNRHADAMDNYPEPNCLPRAADDQQEAKTLSKVLPVILEQNAFKKTYSNCWWQKIKSGCSVYGVFWDQQKLGGLGDIAVRRCDPLNLFWEPGITDIQESRNLFQVELVDNETLVEQYPQLEGKLKGQSEIAKKYVYDDKVDTSKKSTVVDWYYKRRVGGREVLHYCKFVENHVLYATENDTAVPTRMQYQGTDDYGVPIVTEVPAGRSMAERGWYDHGKYPFVFDVLFPEEGTPCGFGYIDICKNPQVQIDLMNRAFIENTLAAARPRFFIRNDGAVNEKEFADWNKPFVHTDGNLGQDSIMPITTPQLSGNYLNVMQMKQHEMRETSGNTEANTGSVPSSVTAASAIAALQEASGKLSRDMIDGGYDAVREVILLAIDLIRQFYDAPRTFRITGEQGEDQFTSYDNRNLQPKPIMGMSGRQMGYRTPVFDIEVVPQRENEYTKETYNQLALKFLQLGMFTPQQAEQALLTLDMMDFKGKEALVQKISKNGAMFQQLVQMQQTALQLAQMVDATKGTNYAEQIAAQINGQPAPPVSMGGEAEMPGPETNHDEAATTAKARAQTQNAARPR